MEPDGLALGCSGGSLDDEALRDGNCGDGLRFRLEHRMRRRTAFARGCSGGALDD